MRENALMVAYTCVNIVWAQMSSEGVPVGSAFINTYDYTFATVHDEFANQYYYDDESVSDYYESVSEYYAGAPAVPTGSYGGSYATPFACKSDNQFEITADAGFANVDLSGTSFAIQGAKSWASARCSGASFCACTYPLAYGWFGPSKCPGFSIHAIGPISFYYSSSGQAVTIFAEGSCANVYPSGSATGSVYNSTQFLPLDGVVLGVSVNGVCVYADSASGYFSTTRCFSCSRA